MKMSEFFSKKIEVANGLLNSYKRLEAALTYLIENPDKSVSEPVQNLQTAQYEVQRFDSQSAIISQQFNIDELVRKHDEYNGKIEQLRERMPREWEPTLVAIKKKMVKRSDQKPAIGIQDLANIVQRAEQPFESEEEKIEFFQSMLDVSQ